MPADDDARRYVEDPATGAALQPSAEWSQVEAPPGVLAIAVTSWQDVRVADVRPNVTLVCEPAPPDVEDVRTMGTLAVARAMCSFHDAHVIAYDVWAPEDGPGGRSLAFTYRDGEIGVFVGQWLFHHRGILTTVTGTCGIDMLSTLDPYFRFFAATVRLPLTATVTRTP